jgi:hypothetical protein
MRGVCYCMNCREFFNGFSDEVCTVYSVEKDHESYHFVLVVLVAFFGEVPLILHLLVRVLHVESEVNLLDGQVKFSYGMELSITERKDQIGLVVLRTKFTWMAITVFRLFLFVRIIIENINSSVCEY